MRHLRQRAGHLHTDRARAHQDKRQQLLNFLSAPLAECRHLFGPFKCQQNFAADQVSIIQRFQAGRDLLPLVVPEVVVLNAGGYDQIVVRQFILPQTDQPLLRIDSADFVEQHFNIALAAEDRTQRPRDFVG